MMTNHDNKEGWKNSIGSSPDHSSKYVKLYAELKSENDESCEALLTERTKLLTDLGGAARATKDISVSSKSSKGSCSGSNCVADCAGQAFQAEACFSEGKAELGENLCAKVEAMELLCDSLQNIYDAIQRDYPDASSACHIKPGFRSSTVQDLRDFLASFEGMVLRVSRHNSEYIIDAEKWRQLYNEVVTQNNFHEGKIQLLHDSLSDLQTERIVLQDSVDSLRQELESVIQNYQHSQSENELLQAELDKLQFQMDTNETDDSKEISELKMQLDELKQEREDFIKMVTERDDSLHKQHARLDSVLEEQGRDMKQLQEELLHTRLLLAEREENYKRLEQESISLKGTINLLNDNGNLRRASSANRKDSQACLSPVNEVEPYIVVDGQHESFARPDHLVEEELVDELDLAEVAALNSASLEVSVEEEDVPQLTHQSDQSLSLQVEQLQGWLADKDRECQQLQDRVLKLTEQNPELLDFDLLREESLQLKRVLVENERELTRLRASLLESQNSSSDLILIQQECRQLKQLISSSSQELQKALGAIAQRESECQVLHTRLLEAQNENSDLALVREESRQLKVMLKEKEKELIEARQNSRISSVSDDLHWLQEECRQTKVLLLEKDEQCRILRVEIADARNQISDLELLHEECSKLKSMLMKQERTVQDSGKSVAGTQGTVDGRDLKDALYRRDQELNLLRRKLADLENCSANADLLQEECRQLKIMLAEKSEQLLSSDSPTSAENQSRYTALVMQYNSLVQHYQQLQEMYMQKEREVKELQIAVSESDSQDENIHLLQTEYRAVEEKLSVRDKELVELREKLFAAETLCDRANTYKEQFAQLKKVLADKDTELANLKLQSSEASILESESVALLQQEMNQLRGMLYEREKEIKELHDVLKKKNFELQQVHQMLEASAKDYQHLKSSTVDSKSYEQLDGQVHSQECVISGLNSSIAALRSECDVSSVQLREKDSALNDVRLVLVRTEEAEQRLRKSLKDLKAESSAEIRDLNAEMAELRFVHDGLQKELHEVKEGLRLANAKVLELESVRASLERKVARLQDEIMVKDSDVEAFSERYNAADAEAKRHQGVLARQIGEIEALSRTISDLEQANQELLEKSVNLETQRISHNASLEEVDALRSSLALQNTELRQLRLSLQNKDDEISHTRKLLSSRDTEMLLQGEKIEKLEKLCQEQVKEHGASSSNTSIDSSNDQDIAANVTAQLDIRINACAKLEEEVLSMKMQNNSLISEVANLEAGLRKAETTVLANSELLQGEQLRVQELEMKLRDQQRKSKKSSIAKEKALACANTEIAELTDKITVQNEQIRNLNEKIDKCSILASEKEERIQHLHLSLDTIRDLLELRNNELRSASLALETAKENSKVQVNEMQVELTALRSLVNEKSSENESNRDVVAGLRRQLSDKVELEALYSEKCSECEALHRELGILQDHIKRGHAAETEADVMRSMVEKNSKLYLEKTKDCDRLSLEVIQLESRLYDLRLELDKQTSKTSQAEAVATQVKNLEKELLESRSLTKTLEANLTTANLSLEQVTKNLANAKMSLAEKNSRIDELESSVSRLEASARSEENARESTSERVVALASVPLLDVPGSSKDISDAHSPAHDIILRLQKEKTDLFEENHRQELRNRELEKTRQVLEARITELEVVVKHQEVKCKEIEVKTARELERLRNHMVKMEEGYTKDIIDGKEREKVLEGELDSAKNLLSQKSHNFQSTSDEFHSTLSDMQEQVKALALQKEHLSAELNKRKLQADHSAAAMKNLQLALEQLQREKEEQHDYLTEASRRQLDQAHSEIEELRLRENQTQSRIQEAHLAVQGVAKLSTDMQQKDEQVKTYKDRVASLSSLLHERERQLRAVVEAAEHRLDRALMKNLLVGYFQAPESKRADIIHVIGGLLGLSNVEVEKIGTGAAPNNGGWVSSVFSFGGTPAKSQLPDTQARKEFRNEILKSANQSFSELFVSFLQHETEKGSLVPTASLAPTDIPNLPPLPFLQPANGPLAFSAQPFSSAKPALSLANSPRIPAPGQEIPRVHTHQAQTTLKSLLAT